MDAPKISTKRSKDNSKDDSKDVNTDSPKKQKKSHEPTSSKTRVVRLRRQGGKIVQDCDVYVGRQCTRGGWNLPRSKWANPFFAKTPADRAKITEQYRKWIAHQPELLAALPELKGRVLGCWCHPAPCHAHVLAELADKCWTKQLKENNQKKKKFLLCTILFYCTLKPNTIYKQSSFREPLASMYKDWYRSRVQDFFFRHMQRR